MIDHWMALSHLRERVGAPDLDRTTQRKLSGYFASALEWLASEFGSKIVTITGGITLTADTYRYPLPRDAFEILWLEWDGTRLDRGSTGGWNRDRRNWRTAISGTLSEWATEGSTLLLFPPPSSDALLTSSVLDLSYIAGGLSLQPDGVPGFSDLDMWCCVFKAADEYLGMHPSEENAARRQAVREEWQLRLPTCIGNHQGGPARIAVWSSRTR